MFWPTNVATGGGGAADGAGTAGGEGEGGEEEEATAPSDDVLRERDANALSLGVEAGTAAVDGSTGLTRPSEPKSWWVASDLGVDTLGLVEEEGVGKGGEVVDEEGAGEDESRVACG